MMTTYATCKLFIIITNAWADVFEGKNTRKEKAGIYWEREKKSEKLSRIGV